MSIRLLLENPDPLLRWKVSRRLLELPPTDPSSRSLVSAVRYCDRVRGLLGEQGTDGTIPYHPYSKWYGAHWVLAVLADMEYPSGDKRLQPLLDQDLDWILNKKPVKVDGRFRVCASQQAYTLYSMLKLGVSTESAPELAKRLMEWQWPDGGWNCDKIPPADSSSFMETLIPIRALALYGQLMDDASAPEAVRKASEVFLTRKLFRRRSDNRIMDADFVRLHYPCYWRYDILFGLKVMAEAGYIRDPRCQEALDLLESRCLPSGGFPADRKYYQLSDRCLTSCSRVSWGHTGKFPNPYVTADAWIVLKAAGRLESSMINGGSW